MEIPISCNLCPRACGVDRRVATGLCGGGAAVTVARAALHHWEEPCVSGTRGSGTVFFSGCPLHCCYCQNHAISGGGTGKAISTRALADIFLRLQEQGAHNINLVTAGHWLPWVLEALFWAKPTLHIPIVYNTGGYETPASIEMLKGMVDIYLTDLKYSSTVLSAAYSSAPDYFTVALAAAKAMIAQVGAPVLDAAGLLQRGVIVRHLALPGASADTKAVLEAMALHLPKDGFLLSLMRQYTPAHKAIGHKALGRRLSTYEYKKALDTAIALGLTQGYTQEKSSAKKEYTPPFDGTGI